MPDCGWYGTIGMGKRAVKRPVAWKPLGVVPQSPPRGFLRFNRCFAPRGGNMQSGYIKLYRCVLDSGWSRHPDYMAVWVYCLLRGNYKADDVVTKWGGIVHLEPGQFITSREQISLNTGVQESKVERILKHFKSEQQIEQQNHGKFRIISILNWHKYQASEQDFEQQVNNTRTTGEQQVNTDKKVKKEKKKTFAVFVAKKIEEYFDVLYDDHPRKERGKDAKRHYLTSVKTIDDVGKIESALNSYTAQCKKKDKQFIMQAGTWFNNWQDYQTSEWQDIAADLKTTWETEYEDHQREKDGTGADD